MSLDVIKKMRSGTADNEADLICAIEEYASKGNTRDIRKDLVQLLHYCHVLQCGGNLSYAELYNKTWYLAEDKISNARTYEGYLREAISLRVIEEHCQCYNLANRYYEKAGKVLCQMIITIMDYMLQETGHISLLYKDINKADYLDLNDEMTELYDIYKDSYAYLLAYDICTKRIGDFVDVKEYSDLYEVHERLETNGLPARTAAAVVMLGQLVGEDKIEPITAIRNELVHQSSMFAIDANEIYNRVLEEHFQGNDVDAMASLGELMYKIHDYMSPQ